MIRTLRSLLLGGLFLAAATPAVAQDGFALKGGYIYNRAEAQSGAELKGSNGFTLGLEYVLPLGFGVGVSGYTAGKIGEYDAATSDVNVLAEANYFLNLPILPVSPYVGVHAGLGRYSQRDDVAPGARLQDNWRQFGYQAGVRAQLISIFGLDAQFRRVSTSLENEQGVGLSRNQVVIGITLF